MFCLIDHERGNGVLTIVSAYIIWGFLPIYWSLVDHLSPGEILAHRIMWSFLLMVGIVLLSGNWTAFIRELIIIFNDRKKFISMMIASAVISINWLTYIWAVNNGHVVEASLGYYINPLISILFGMIILRESVTNRQIISFIIAGAGVIMLTYHFGAFPWIAFILAISFAIYGLLKKLVDVQPMFGLTIETMFVAPFAIAYLVIVPTRAFTIGAIVSSTSFLLIGAGVVTAVPLLLFASGAQKIPLAMLGFLQYIAPTIMLMIGIFVFKETFSRVQLFSFSMIWFALIIYLGSIQAHKGTKLADNLQ